MPASSPIRVTIGSAAGPAASNTRATSSIRNLRPPAQECEQRQDHLADEADRVDDAGPPAHERPARPARRVRPRRRRRHRRAAARPARSPAAGAALPARRRRPAPHPWPRGAVASSNRKAGSTESQRPARMRRASAAGPCPGARFRRPAPRRPAAVPPASSRRRGRTSRVATLGVDGGARWPRLPLHRRDDKLVDLKIASSNPASATKLPRSVDVLAWGSRSCDTNASIDLVEAAGTRRRVVAGRDQQVGVELVGRFDDVPTTEPFRCG